MKPIPLIATLLAFAYVSPLAAGTVQCVPTQGCPKGSKPPACCQPPPCEVYEQIKMKQTLRRYYRNDDVKDLFIKRAGGDNSKAADLLADWVKAKAANLGSELRCKWEAPHGYAATFETKAWCQIFAKYSEENQESMSERQAHEKFDTCSEFISAIYEHEGHHKEMCMGSDEYKKIAKEIVQLSTGNLWHIGTVGIVPKPTILKLALKNTPEVGVRLYSGYRFWMIYDADQWFYIE